MTIEQIAEALWNEQCETGVADPSERATNTVEDWIAEHDERLLECASQGDVAALVELREACGLPVLR